MSYQKLNVPTIKELNGYTDIHICCSPFVDFIKNPTSIKVYANDDFAVPYFSCLTETYLPLHQSKLASNFIQFDIKPTVNKLDIEIETYSDYDINTIKITKYPFQQHRESLIR